MSGIRKVDVDRETRKAWKAVTLCGVALSTTALAAPGDAKVKASLLAESTACTPGAEQYIGVHLKMEKGWHVYWRYAGDSGAPILVEFDAPEGVTIGQPLWPAPQRYIDGGVLLNYTYEDEVTLLFPVTLDADAQPGQTFTIDADISWLVCKEYCFPGAGEASLTLRAGSDGAPTPAAPLFETARRNLPRDWKQARRDGVTATWTGSDLTFHAPGATTIEFYPYPESEDVEVLPTADMLKAGTTRDERLAITYGDDARDAPHVLGVLRVQRAPGTQPVCYDIDIPGPGRAPGAPDQ